MSGRGRKPAGSKKRLAKKVDDAKESPRSEPATAAIPVGVYERGPSPERSTSRSPRSVTPPSSGEVSAKSRDKKDRKGYTLTKDEEDTLATWLQSPETSIIWDMKKTDYKNKAKKDRLWEEISLQLDKSIQHLQGWWRTNRDSYTRLHQRKKGKSGDGQPENDDLNKRESWLLQSMSFLQRQVRHQPKSVNPIDTASGVDLEEMEDKAAWTDLDPDAAIGPSHSKARRRTSMDDSELSSLLEQLTASTQRMEELQRELVASSRPSSKSNFANYMKVEILNYTDEQFLRAKPRLIGLLEELDRDFAAVPPPSTTSQYFSDVPDMPVRHIPVGRPPVACQTYFQPIQSQNSQSQYTQSQYSQPERQQQQPPTHTLLRSAPGKPSPLTLPPGSLGPRATSRVLDTSDVPLGGISLSELQGYTDASSNSVAYEDLNTPQ